MNRKPEHTSTPAEKVLKDAIREIFVSIYHHGDDTDGPAGARHPTNAEWLNSNLDFAFQGVLCRLKRGGITL